LNIELDAEKTKIGQSLALMAKLVQQSFETKLRLFTD
jgi:hypothetical protein